MTAGNLLPATSSPNVSYVATTYYAQRLTTGP